LDTGHLELRLELPSITILLLLRGCPSSEIDALSSSCRSKMVDRLHPGFTMTTMLGLDKLIQLAFSCIFTCQGQGFVPETTLPLFFLCKPASQRSRKPILILYSSFPSMDTVISLASRSYPACPPPCCLSFSPDNPHIDIYALVPFSTNRAITEARAKSPAKLAAESRSHRYLL